MLSIQTRDPLPVELPMQCKRLLLRAAAALTLAALCGSVETPGRLEVRAFEQSREAAVVAPGLVISDREVDELAKANLIRIRAEEYAVKKEVLEEQIAKILMEREADSRGITFEELTLREIESKIHLKFPLMKEIDARRVNFHLGFGERRAETKEELADIIEEDWFWKLHRVRRNFVATLKAKAGTKIFLEPPRFPIELSGGVTKGPVDAPVTIVEFADFQCPHCRIGGLVLKDVEERFPGKLRIVYRHFPLPALEDAAKAAEAAECANEQGKFWEMHDKLLDNQPRRSLDFAPSLRPVDLKQKAVDLALDTKRFNECLNSGRYAPEWQRGLADGRRYGVSETPTFFVNGRLVWLANLGWLWERNMLEALTDIIEEELGRVAPSGR